MHLLAWRWCSFLEVMLHMLFGSAIALMRAGAPIVSEKSVDALKEWNCMIAIIVRWLRVMHRRPKRA